MNQSDNTTPHKAENYDKNVRETIPFYCYFHTETIDLVKNLKPDVRVWLDTGCGTGTLIREALAHFPKTVFILADPSENMLMEAKKKLGEASQRIQFLDPVGTEDIMPGGIPQPEVITALQSHHYFDVERRKNATTCCYNLLADSGIYITFENIRSNSEEGIEISLNRWMQFQKAQGRGEAAVRDHRKRFNTSYFPITVNEHIHLLKTCGFRVAELFWYSHMQAGFYAIK